MAKRDLLVGWLKDAHSMEQSQKKMLERFSGDFDSLPDAKTKLDKTDKTDKTVRPLKCINYYITISRTALV